MIVMALVTQEEKCGWSIDVEGLRSGWSLQVLLTASPFWLIE